MPRFDIGPASRLESRDGGLTRGGLIQNGFLEASPEGVWSYQRPGLAPGTAAPVSGTGMGLIPIGTNLYGLWNNGTATSQIVAVPKVTSFTLTAAYSGSPGQYGFLTPIYGGLSPSTWRSQTILGFTSNSSNNTTGLIASGNVAQSFIVGVQIAGVLLPTSIASYSYNGTVSVWNWSPALITAPGSYKGRFY